MSSRCCFMHEPTTILHRVDTCPVLAEHALRSLLCSALLAPRFIFLSPKGSSRFLDNAWPSIRHVSVPCRPRQNSSLPEISSDNHPIYSARKDLSLFSFLLAHFDTSRLLCFFLCFQNSIPRASFYGFFFPSLLHAVRMAQLMSSVCADALKFQNPVLSLCSRSPCRVSAKAGTWNPSGCGARRRACGRVKVATDDSAALDSVADDYYAVLGLPPEATQAQIKKAYYNCMKECHPDLSGNDPETNNFCMFINEVYAVLSDPVQRMVYDEIHGYALTAVNPFLDGSCPKDHAFVDEFSCIGCKNCANVAPDVFAIEEDFGRARAYSQFGNPDLVQQAIDSCPVDCIHWTSAPQLSLLEDEMRRVERVNVAMMLSGMGSGSVDVFRMANSRWEKRQAKVLEQAKIRMMQQKDSGKSESYWSDLWGKPKDHRDSEEQINDRARRAAAAARRWREYSRRGVDKPPTFKLPEAASNTESTL